MSWIVWPLSMLDRLIVPPTVMLPPKDLSVWAIRLALMETGGDATGWMWSSDGAAVIDDPAAQSPTATNVTDGEVFTVVVTNAAGGVDTCFCSGNGK